MGVELVALAEDVDVLAGMAMDSDAAVQDTSEACLIRIYVWIHTSIVCLRSSCVESSCRYYKTFLKLSKHKKQLLH